MANEQTRRQKILIVDDSEMNRSILADMLEDEFDIVEAENGLEAVSILQKHADEISLVLLDIVMPEMDGFEVLMVMNQRQWIDDVPVIMISAETRSSQIERAYKLGITDFISRPFDALIVHRRVVNTILLYAKQKKLVGLVEEQIYEKERHSNLMIEVLSHIVEFRNGESGMHVRNVRTLTELLLRQLVQKNNRYQLSPMDISIIGTASALHDIGKIAIDEAILNKPGKFTDEEFAIMKTHTTIGAKMLDEMVIYRDEPLVRAAHDICRWHHERYDGRGYPDGLAGDAIPISAQVVAVADVYDALTSERCYKKAIPHEQAIMMILESKCGVFNPELMECLIATADVIQDVAHNIKPEEVSRRNIQSITQEMLSHEELTASERTLELLEHERMKYNFFAALTQEIQFEYTLSPAMLTLSSWGANRLKLGEIVMDPLHNENVLSILDEKNLKSMTSALHSTSPKKPVVTHDCRVCLDGEKRWFRIIARATWSSEEPPRYTGCIGKAMDIHDSRMKLTALEQLASHDPLTGLLNHAYARQRIAERLAELPDCHYAMVIFDLDHFKSANDTYGHIFGDQVLKHVAHCLQSSIRTGDIAARVGGDEFLLFLEYDTDLESIIQRIFHALCGQYEDFPISISMGIARTQTVGTAYEDLFHAADQALYTVKRSGRGQYKFYNDTMKQMLSVISPIDGSQEDDTHSVQEGADYK